MVPDHPMLTLDSLHEEADSPVKGLVHRYPDKALFLRESSLPLWFLAPDARHCPAPLDLHPRSFYPLPLSPPPSGGRY